MKTFFRFIFSKLFIKQFLIAMAILVVMFFATTISLRLFTLHGRSIQVPDVKGFNEAQVARLITKEDLRYVIIDSVYTEEVLPGTVFEQIPKAGAFVKKNRKIYLILNAKQNEEVMMPSLKNVSLRQAKVMIKQNGLKLGEIIYVTSEYKDLVINQMVGDTIVSPGTMVNKFSTVDLQVGRGLGDTKITAPYLRGMYLVDAIDEIVALNLNQGAIMKDGSITKKSNLDSAFVWKQYPQPEVEVKLGKSVDLWLTMDTAVVYAADTTLRLQ